MIPRIGMGAVAPGVGFAAVAMNTVGTAGVGALFGLLIGALAKKNLGKSAIVGGGIGAGVGFISGLSAVAVANSVPATGTGTPMQILPGDSR